MELIHGSDKALGHGVDHYDAIVLEHENILQMLDQETWDAASGKMLSGWDRVNNSDFLRIIKAEVSMILHTHVFRCSLMCCFVDGVAYCAWHTSVLSKQCHADVHVLVLLL